MLNRLCGLETEYAIRFHAREPGMERVSHAHIVQGLLGDIRKQMPTALEWPFDKGYFLVNGGMMRFEGGTLSFGDPACGYLEGATPECRGPRELALYQRAQDRLLRETTQRISEPGGSEVNLVKNNRDAEGNCYGSHENYEVTIASGRSLLWWRRGISATPWLLMSFPLIFVAFLPVTTAVVGLLLYALLTPVYLLLHLRELTVLLLPAFLVFAYLRRDRLTSMILSMMRGLAYWSIVSSFSGLILFLGLLGHLTVCRTLRQRLTAFLVTRQVFAGAGQLSKDGKTFELSQRARQCRWVFTPCSDVGVSIYKIGHVLKHMLRGAASEEIMRPRQRLQICVGDSNMAPFAEYLRLGTTMLLIDAIEAGALADAPVLAHPIRALRAISADPSLQVRVKLADGQRWSALDIQRYYLEACRRFVAESHEDTTEAMEILDHWEHTLIALEADPESLVGKVDWITKRYLLDTAGKRQSPEARRKIDIRYHELSSAGYFALFEATGTAPALHTIDQIEKAIRTAPVGTPAATRSRYIREFSGGDVPMRATWDMVILQGKNVPLRAGNDDAGG
jgi:proteasome accessory factor A